MSFSIMTWMDDGGPRLGVVDTGTGQLRQLWRLHKLPASGCDGAQDPSPPMVLPEKGRMTDLQQLVRQLFLFGCRSDVRQAARRPDETCEQEAVMGSGRHPKVWLVYPTARSSTAPGFTPPMEVHDAIALRGGARVRKLGGGVSS